MTRQLSKFMSAMPYLVLALCLSACVLSAAGLYASANGLYSDGSGTRVCTQFLRTRLRQGDVLDAVRADPDAGIIYIREEYPEGTFCSALYVHDGWLTEQLLAEGVEFDPAMGDRIVPCEGIGIEDADDGILACRLCLDGDWHEVRISVRSAWHGE